MTRGLFSLFTMAVLLLALPSSVFAWCSVVAHLMDRWLFAPSVYLVMAVSFLLYLWLLSRLPTERAWATVLMRILAFGVGVTLVLAVGAPRHGYCHCLSWPG